jgi:hypothetical protein
MAIPDAVKLQAKNVISHPETQAMFRAANITEASHASLFTHREEPKPEISPLTDEAKRQSKNAITHPETQAMINLAANEDGVKSPVTPSRRGLEISGKIESMHGLDVSQMQKTMTQDAFGSER